MDGTAGCGSHASEASWETADCCDVLPVAVAGAATPVRAAHVAPHKLCNVALRAARSSPAAQPRTAARNNKEEM